MHPLISARGLAARLDDVTVLDVRWKGGEPGPEAFAAGHVPGAAYVDLDRDLVGGQGEGAMPLPDPVMLQETMRRLGVRESRPVVVYDDWGGRAAARCWWLLRWAGKDDVRVLDGGWSTWDGPVATGPAEPAAGDLVVRPGAMPVVDSDDVAHFEGVLVDARPAADYRDGHVPGAVDVPTDTSLGAEGRMRPADQVQALLAASGVDGEQPVASYCGSAVLACFNVLAMETVGVRAALYPGSWSAWSSDPDRPVESGEGA